MGFGLAKQLPLALAYVSSEALSLLFGVGFTGHKHLKLLSVLYLVGRKTTISG